MMAFFRVGAVALATGLLLTAGLAGAQTEGPYANHVGPNFTYTNVQGTTASGPPVLWGAPTYVNDTMNFFPPGFVATTTGGGVDFVSSQLQAQMEANFNTSANTYINMVSITEFGDLSLLGFGGTASTGVSVAMSGFVTVLEDSSGPLAVPEVINFTATYSPNIPGGFVTYPDLPGPGSDVWSATAFVDIAAVVPEATLVQLSLDNSLFAGSEPTTSALIQKKVVISVIPEPGTALLVGSGLILLGLRGRRVRHAA